MTRAMRMQWLLPVVWGLGCVIGYGNPGDEYGLFALGSIVGTWTLLLADEGIAVGLPLVVGCALMFGAGGLLDRLHANRNAWLTTWLLVGGATCAFSIAQFESVEHAIAKNGSYGAYVAFASQAGTYVATVLTLAVAAVRTWFGEPRDGSASIVSSTTGA